MATLRLLFVCWLCLLSGSIADDLTLCDENLFSLPMVNVDYNRFEIYRNEHEWDVFNLSVVSLKGNVSMPGELLQLVSTESAVLVAKNWSNDTWIALSARQLYRYDCKMHSTFLDQTPHVNTLFYSPLDQNIYAIADTQIFAILSDNSSQKFQPTDQALSMAQVKLVLFTDQSTMYLIEKTRYATCNVTLQEQLHFECSDWKDGDIICTSASQDSGSMGFFWVILSSLVVSIIVLIILLVWCTDHKPPSDQTNANIKSNFKMSSANSGGKASSGELKSTQKQKQAKSHKLSNKTKAGTSEDKHFAKSKHP